MKRLWVFILGLTVALGGCQSVTNQPGQLSTSEVKSIAPKVDAKIAAVSSTLHKYCLLIETAGSLAGAFASGKYQQIAVNANAAVKAYCQEPPATDVATAIAEVKNIYVSIQMANQ